MDGVRSKVGLVLVNHVPFGCTIQDLLLELLRGMLALCVLKILSKGLYSFDFCSYFFSQQHVAVV